MCLTLSHRKYLIIRTKHIDIPQVSREESAGPVIYSAQSECAECLCCWLGPQGVLEGFHVFLELAAEHVKIVSGPDGAWEHTCAIDLRGCHHQLMLSPVDAGLDPSVVFFLTAAGCKKCRYGNQIYSFQHIGDINRWLAVKSATCVIELLSRVKPDDEREDF